MKASGFLLAVVVQLTWSVGALAQPVHQRFSAGINGQVAGDPMPTTAVGAELAVRLLSRSWWDAGALLSAAKADPTGIVCVGPTDVACDARTIGSIVAGEAVLTLGPAARHVYARFGAGAYGTRWKDGASGAGPSGATFDGGLGSRLPVFGDRLLVELRLRRYLNTYVRRKNHSDAVTLAVRCLIP